MHFYCKCGCRISDTTDMIPYKGHIIADQDWYDMWDGLRELVTSEAADREKKFDELFYGSIAAKCVYQCQECGALYLEGQNNQLTAFMAEGGTDTHLLESCLGNRWKGHLYAEWKEEPEDWDPPRKGTIFVEVNGEQRNTYFYDEYGAFEDAYYRLLHELKDICLRSASLKVRNTRTGAWTKVHMWSLEEGTER